MASGTRVLVLARDLDIQVLVLARDLDIRVLDTDGELLRELTLDPAGTTNPQARP